MVQTVVSASLGVLGPLLVKLTGLLAGEYGRLKGVRREIQSLQSELTSMHAALEEYTKLEDPSGQVKAWISLVRELAYDTEDVFDKFIHQFRKGRHRGGFKEFLHKITLPLKTLGARHGIANKIDDLKVRIKQVKDLKDSYKLNDAPLSTPGPAVVDPRLHALFTEGTHLVGVDGPRDELAKWMLEESNSSQHCKVLSIVGFGGLGKTTLANEVYRNIQEEFQCQAFVSVSQKPDIKNIIKDVFSQVSREDGSKIDTNDWDEKRSITKLRELLQDKRYIIIIDDIWSIQAWNTIKCAFPENNYSSRIVATTRIVDIAKSCSSATDDRIYEMEALSYLDSEKLLFKRVFGSNHNCPDMLKEVSNKILKKCGGLPLAITSISGLLASKPAIKEEWEKVKRSIGPALENNRSLEGMGSILILSYNDLPHNLKTCLLYLSVFPEDYLIKKERLVLRWISEGFISEERGQSQYEVAESYFYELINKSIVQPVEIGYDGKVHGCRIHDMMLEIIHSKSAEANFITVVTRGQMSLSNRHGIIRRLSIQYIDHELALALTNEDLSHVRSLTVTASDCIKHLPNLVEFEALRVLDFEGCKGLDNIYMNSMDKLYNLRYVGLRGTNTSSLPSRIVMLNDLETLDFRDTHVQELPPGFAQLSKLQHLLLNGSKIKIPRGIGIMRKLRVISGFNGTLSPADALVELGDLTCLSELFVYLECGDSECGVPDMYKTHEEKLFSSLQKLICSSKLKYLSIQSTSRSLECLESWPPLPSALQVFHTNTHYYFTNLPKWIAPTLTSLTSLDINLTELTEGCLHTLGELPALLGLVLTLETGEGSITVKGIGFPCLKQFQISYGSGKYTTFMKGAMPKLEYLKLELPVSVGRNGAQLGIVHLPSLKGGFICVQPEGATKSEHITAIAAIKEEFAAHINHPRVFIIDGNSEALIP